MTYLVATKSRSLAGKLAVLYAITTFSVLLLASGFLYWSVLNHLQREHQHLLSAKIIELKHYFRHSIVFGDQLHNLIDVQHHHSQMPHSSAIHPGIPHHVFVRILNEEGELIVQSDIMPSLPLHLNFPEVERTDNDVVHIVKTNFAHQQLLLGSSWVKTSADHQHQWLLIRGVLELEADEILLSEYRTTLLTVLLLGVLACATTGYGITRRGLRPLHQMTKAIQSINVNKLHQRVGMRAWPSEIVLLARAFDQMLQRLDDSFERLSQFSADLAHELRTPVNNIMGEVEVALSRTRTDEEYVHVLVSTREECDRLARMIDELLFLAKAENPQTQIKRDFLPLAKEFANIKEFYTTIAEEKQIRILCRANEKTVYADAGLLRRALSNILTNAIRHSRPGDSILLLAESKQSDIVNIIIEDNGEGIPKEQLPYLFERFFQTDKSRHHQAQGSGLGLAIVKSIMHLHGGEVSISSRLAHGTRVELSFPENSVKMKK